MQCLRSLILTDPQDDLAAIRSAKGDRVGGTCEWILTQHQYTRWLVTDSPQLLWLSGAPGIGKTMISTFLIGEFAHLAGRSPQTILAYYFCDDKYQDRRTATAILRGLLLQLLRQRPTLFKHIQSQFEMSPDRLFTNFHALWRVFVSMVLDPEVAEVYCLIDALDECEKESRELFLKDFVKLFHFQESKKTSIKFIVTSRREQDIEESLSLVSPAIRNVQVDSGRVNHDLHKFINTKVDELSAIKGYTSALKEDIRCALLEKAGGTFLYVSLVLHDLRKTKIASQVTQKLRDLPADLYKIYDRIVSLIDKDCEKMAKLVLRWVVVARRPLTIVELAEVCALESDEYEENTIPQEDLLDRLQDVYKCCEPLVSVDTRNDTINFVHQSAKDYLLGNYLRGNVDLSQYHVLPNETNLLAFKACWTYMILEESRQATLYKRDNGYSNESASSKEEYVECCFPSYASNGVYDHALAAGVAWATDGNSWKDDLNKLPESRDFLLIIATEEGKAALVQRLLEEGAESNTTIRNDRTPLFLAVSRGDEAIVRILLSRDDVAADYQYYHGQTPLSWAAEIGQEAIVRILLSRDDVAADSRGDQGRTPLSWEAQEGPEAEVRMLLSREEVLADSQDILGRTPLSWVAETGREAVVRILLSRHDVVADALDHYKRTPLSHAAQGRHEDSLGRTLPLLVAEAGREAVVRMLLSRRDVTADALDRYKRTPLSYAAQSGYEAIVKLLLNRSDVVAHSRDNLGRTPLSRAAERGHMAVVKLLLNRGDVVIDSKDIWGPTPLLWALQGGHEAVVGLLLIDSRDSRGKTPLGWVVTCGHEEIVRLLSQKMEEVSYVLYCQRHDVLSE